MDSPAFGRRKLKNVKSLKKDEEQAKKEEEDLDTEQKKGDKLLNERHERIDKSDTNQPAFLRKIMD
jgi:cell division protein FtsZ